MTMNLSRRGFLGMFAAGAGAAIITTPGLLMPIKSALVRQAVPALVYRDDFRGVEIPVDVNCDGGIFAGMCRALLDAPLGSNRDGYFAATPLARETFELAVILDRLPMIETFRPGMYEYRALQHFRGVPIRDAA